MFMGSNMQEKEKTGIQIYAFKQVSWKLHVWFPNNKWENTHKAAA